MNINALIELMAHGLTKSRANDFMYDWELRYSTMILTVNVWVDANGNCMRYLMENATVIPNVHRDLDLSWVQGYKVWNIEHIKLAVRDQVPILFFRTQYQVARPTSIYFDKKGTYRDEEVHWYLITFAGSSRQWAIPVKPETGNVSMANMAWVMTEEEIRQEEEDERMELQAKAEFAAMLANDPDVERLEVNVDFSGLVPDDISEITDDKED